MTSNDELLYYMLGQVNQERGWDLPQALCATNRCHWQREHEPKYCDISPDLAGTLDEANYE
jgi:hypothetical protein